MKTPEELLKPRWIMTNDYPNCDHYIGKIFFEEPNGTVKLSQHETARLEALAVFVQEIRVVGRTEGGGYAEVCEGQQ